MSGACIPLPFLPRAVRGARAIVLRWEGIRRDYDDWVPLDLVAADIGVQGAELRAQVLRRELHAHRAHGVTCLDFGQARTLLCRHAPCSWLDLMASVTGV